MLEALLDHFGSSSESGLLHRWAFFHELLYPLSAVLWLLAYAALLHKLRRDRNAQGISMQSLFALLTGNVTTLISMLIVLTNSQTTGVISIPTFSSQFITTLLVTVTFTIALKHFAATYQPEKDVFGKWPAALKQWPSSASSASTRITASQDVGLRRGGKGLKFRLVFGRHWVFLYLVAFALAAFVEHFRTHRLLHWTVSYVDCVGDMILALALLPQLAMFHHSKNRRIAYSLTRFIFSMLLAQVVTLLYWLSDRAFHGEKVMPGRGVKILGGVLNILILSDFCVFVIKSKLAGRQDTELPI